MPNPLDPATWVAGLVGGFVNLFYGAYTNLIEQIIQLLFMTALPSPDKIATSWAVIGMGATYGAAIQILNWVTVLVGLYVLIRIRKDHGLTLGRIVWSTFGLLVLGGAFFPVYGMAYSLSQGFVQALLNVATGSTHATTSSLTAIVKVVFPDDPFWKLVTVALADVFGAITFIEALALQGILIVTLVFYPLGIALRPLKGPAIGLFNLMNAALVTVVFSPPIMGIGFVVPVLVHNLVPGGTLPLASAVVTVIGGIFAAVTPLVLAVMTYRQSREIFGTVDATIGGKLDISSMPPVTLKDVQQSVQETHRASWLRTGMEIGTGLVGLADIADDESLFGTPKEALQTTLKATGLIATASGHPEVGALATTAGSYLQSRGSKSSTTSMVDTSYEPSFEQPVARQPDQSTEQPFTS